MITAKDKAKKLVDKFISRGCLFANAKQCALICVDELIRENTEIETMVGQGFNLDYWQSVRTEINNL
jgi:hypothetical protein